MMNKLSTLALGGLLTAAISSTAYAEPTRTFFSETAETAIDGTVSIDVEYQFNESGTNTGARIGAFGGEVLLNNGNTGFATSSIGYKKIFQKDLAFYGILSYLNNDIESFTDIALGAVYTLNLKDVSFNFNGELITDDSETLRGGDSTLFIKAAVIFPINKARTNISLIAEVAVENNDLLDTGTALGLRWQPSSRLTTDFIVFADNGVDDTTGIPGYVKLNFAF